MTARNTKKTSVHHAAGKAARKSLPHTNGKPDTDALMALIAGLGDDSDDGDDAAGLEAAE